jgi:hypothetical protein
MSLDISQKSSQMGMNYALKSQRLLLDAMRPQIVQFNQESNPISTNPGSMMEFYWRNPNGENVSFFSLSSFFPSPYFSKADPFA